MAYISPVLNVMTAAARKAGRPLNRDFGELENLQISMKGPADFVTSADKRTEKILIEELSKARPGCGFLGEEGGAVEGADKPHRFIIDPIDGTTNFLHGIPHFAISIALEREGQLVSATYISSTIGLNTRPAITSPSISSPIEIAKCGMPWRKLVVPSMGSTIQR